MNSGTTRKRNPYEDALKLAVGVLVFLGFFELLAFSIGLPHLPSVLDGIGNSWREGVLPHDIAVSSARWMSGWVIGCGSGVILGLLTGRLRRMAILMEGFLILFRAIPFISLLPLTMRLFGLSEVGKIALIGWASAGICWVIVHQASKAIQPQLLWRAKSLGISKTRWIFSILLPECGESIYAACRSALALGLIVVAIVEIGGVYERSSGLWWSEGLGYRLFRSQDQSSDALLLGAIFSFSALGLIADLTLSGIWFSARRFTFWLRRRRCAHTIHQIKHLPTDASEWDAPVSLEVTALSAGYHSKSVLENFDLNIQPGQTVSIVGPSGCGKTTLLRALAGFAPEDLVVSGQIRLGRNENPRDNSHVGIVMQDAPVFGHLTVWENVIVGNHVNTARDMAACWRLLQDFGLDSHALSKALTLSGGQRQRLALAAAVINKPRLLLLDEPFGALDAITRRQLQLFYWKHIHGKVTALFVTHDLEESLLVADLVKVGLGAASQTVEVNKEGFSPNEWEFNPDFARLRSEILTVLQGSHQVGSQI